ncbi:MAG: glycosyltransferase family 2 protein [bacterium]|nr:glycosyltransferase family 2 protein [bacterium]
MKLIVQIPCLNEEETLPATVRDIPRDIPGVDKVELLVIDDGSRDRTVEVAREVGVEHVISFSRNRGLAKTFAAGIDTCLKLGADIIVNTDGDNQYCGQDIPELIQPILKREADIVVGDREIEKIAHFSFLKKKLQKFGSWVVRRVSYTNLPDTTSGFRAFSREAALKMNVISPFTYTLETIIQAGHKGMAVTHVPIRTNEKLRESRLFTSIRNYVIKSTISIIRTHTMYQALRVFFSIGFLVFMAGFLLGVRFLYFFFTDQNPGGHIQSLILMSVLLMTGFQVMLIGLLADVISANRKLIEDTLYRVKGIELASMRQEKVDVD